MFRMILQYLIPLIAPMVVYSLWLWYAQRRSRSVGDTPPGFTRGGIFWAIVLGAVLLIVSLATLAVTGGVSPDSGIYQAPRFEDGKITDPEYLPELQEQ